MKIECYYYTREWQLLPLSSATHTWTVAGVRQKLHEIAMQMHYHLRSIACCVYACPVMSANLALRL